MTTLTAKKTTEYTAQWPYINCWAYRESMEILDRLIFLLIKKPAKGAMISVLSERLAQDEITDMYRDVWTNYGVKVSVLVKQETLGATVMVRLSLLTLMIFEQFVERNYSDEEAIQLTSRILWIVYEKITDKFWIVTRIFSQKPIKRVRKAMNFFIKYFPYRRPGYDMEIVKADDAEYAFNVHKCPAAEFFDKHGRSDLCVVSWCDLDYPLANKWGVTLERDKTISRGNSLCNFRFLK